jgi:AmmeMemoRadiSam system protein A
MPSTETDARDGARLDALVLDLARRGVEHAVLTGRRLPVGLEELPREMRAPGACFVTLRAAGRLRGCIGTLEAVRPLAFEVVDRAAAAALHDPRFAPVRSDELPGIRVHVSVLGPLEGIPVRSREELLASLEPGRDGLLLAEGGRRATFLPAVWRELSRPEDFVAALERKGGLTSGWSPEREAFRYRVDEIS